MKSLRIPSISGYLEKKPVFLSVYAALVSFLTYSCMYAFRKPFTAATYQLTEEFAVSYKVLLVIAQLIGYTLSKFSGIKIISELKSHYRPAAIIILILFAWFFLLLFAILPPAAGIFCLFLNGIPLGLIWGIVFSYLEGRKTTEFMGAVLTVSFIFSSGFVKSVGKWLMVRFGIDEFTMPFLTGALFILPLLLFVFLLEQVPDPTREDRAARSPRTPMNAEQRSAFLLSFLPAIVVLVLTYVLLTIVRDFRDNFVADIWKEAGYDKIPSLFTITEIPASVIVLVIMSSLVLIRNNFLALRINHVLIISGFGISLLATFAYLSNMISAVWWMTLNGLGLYMGYVPFNCMLFERLIAAFKKPANVGFLMYIADSFGYLGSIAVLLFKEFVSVEVSWIKFFSTMLTGVSAAGIIFVLFSEWYFLKKRKTFVA